MQRWLRVVPLAVFILPVVAPAGRLRRPIKPFMFALRDKKSGPILMSGYVGNPAVE